LPPLGLLTIIVRQQSATEALASQSVSDRYGLANDFDIAAVKRCFPFFVGILAEFTSGPVQS